MTESPEARGSPTPADGDDEVADDARTIGFKVVLVVAPFAVVLILGLLEWWLTSR